MYIGKPGSQKLANDVTIAVTIGNYYAMNNVNMQCNYMLHRMYQQYHTHMYKHIETIQKSHSIHTHTHT